MVSFFCFRKYKSDEFVFPGMLKDEKFQFMFRKHWILFLGIILKFLAQIILLFIVIYFMFFQINYFRFTIEGRIVAIMLCIMWVYFLFSFCIRFINRFNRIIVVTDHRIIDQTRTMITSANFNVYDLRQLQMIDANAPNLYHTILNMGNLEITLKGINTYRTIHYIEKPYEILKKINEVKESALKAQKDMVWFDEYYDYNNENNIKNQS